MAYTANQTPEAQLLLRYVQGDESAFRELVDQYRNGLTAFLRRFLNRYDLVEDVFQETFLQVHASRASFDTGRPLGPWLFTIAANKAKDAIRRIKRHRAVPISTLVSCDDVSTGNILNTFVSLNDTPVTQLEQKDTVVLVRRMVTCLPKKQSEILILAYFNQLKYKEISETLSIPIGTVKSRLHTAVVAFGREWRYFCQDRPPCGASAFLTPGDDRT